MSTSPLVGEAAASLPLLICATCNARTSKKGGPQNSNKARMDCRGTNDPLAHLPVRHGRCEGDDELVGDSPYMLRVLATSPEVRKCTVVGDGRNQAVKGCLSEFHVEARDKYTNRWGRVTPCQRIAALLCTGGSAICPAAGVPSCSPADVAGFPQSASRSCCLFTSFHPPHSWIHFPPPFVHPAVFSIHCAPICPFLFKRHTPGLSIRCTSDNLERLLPIEVRLARGDEECSVAVVLTDDGRYRCEYTLPAAGYWRLEVLSSGTHLPGSPFSVQVRPPAVHLSIVCLFVCLSYHCRLRALTTWILYGQVLELFLLFKILRNHGIFIREMSACLCVCPSIHPCSNPSVRLSVVPPPTCEGVRPSVCPS
jgi:Filamin/ABP280 repeat